MGQRSPSDDKNSYTKLPCWCSHFVPVCRYTRGIIGHSWMCHVHLRTSIFKSFMLWQHGPQDTLMETWPGAVDLDTSSWNPGCGWSHTIQAVEGSWSSECCLRYHCSVANRAHLSSLRVLRHRHWSHQIQTWSYTGSASGPKGCSTSLMPCRFAASLSCQLSRLRLPSLPLPATHLLLRFDHAN